MKKSIIAAGVLCACLPAIAAKYVLVVPLMNSTHAVAAVSVSLSATALTSATVDTPYSHSLQELVAISGDTSPDPSLVNFSVASGSLPKGLILNQGVISGTPQESGLRTFTVRVTYKLKSAIQSYEIPVNLQVSIAPGTLPEGIVGQPYVDFDFTPLLTAGNKSGEISWSVATGNLPAGLSLDSSSGVLSGAPQAPFAGQISIQAAYKGSTGVQVYELVTRSITISLAASTLGAAPHGQPFSFDLKSKLSSTGDPAFSPTAAVFSTQAGSLLPAGLSLSEAGILSGIPTEASAAAKEVKVAAAYRGVVATQTYQLATPVSITNTGGIRQWSDGTTAENCNAYKNPTGGQVYAGATGDGIYLISPAGVPFPVRCDQTTDGGGWTVIQRRETGTVDFYRGRAAYVAGFGSVTGEHWLGLANIRALTASPRELRVDLGRYTGQRDYGLYSGFTISAAPAYAINYSAYVSGGIGDSLSYGRGSKFSTYDYDVDDLPNDNCSVIYHGAWWYTTCHESNLNGGWLAGPHTTFADGVNWKSWTGYYESLTFSEMKVR